MGDPYFHHAHINCSMEYSLYVYITCEYSTDPLGQDCYQLPNLIFNLMSDINLYTINAHGTTQ